MSKVDYTHVTVKPNFADAKAELNALKQSAKGLRKVKRNKEKQLRELVKLRDRVRSLVLQVDYLNGQTVNFMRPDRNKPIEDECEEDTRLD